MITNNKKFPVELLTKYAASLDKDIRAVISNCTRTPEATLKILALDADPVGANAKETLKDIKDAK